MSEKKDDNKDDKIIVSIYAAIKNLIPGYLADISTNIDSIIAALEKHDFATLERLGHSMSGSGGSYGFDAITNLGENIEKSAQQKNSKQIKKCVLELKNYLERVEVVYE